MRLDQSRVIANIWWVTRLLSMSWKVVILISIFNESKQSAQRGAGYNFRKTDDTFNNKTSQIWWFANDRNTRVLLSRNTWNKIWQEKINYAFDVVSCLFMNLLLFQTFRLWNLKWLKYLSFSSSSYERQISNKIIQKQNKSNFISPQSFSLSPTAYRVVN